MLSALTIFVNIDKHSKMCIRDRDNDGVDDDDSSVISKDIAEGKIVSELTAANNIGTVNHAATAVSYTHLQNQQSLKQIRMHNTIS